MVEKIDIADENCIRHRDHLDGGFLHSPAFGLIPVFEIFPVTQPYAWG